MHKAHRTPPYIFLICLKPYLSDYPERPCPADGIRKNDANDGKGDGRGMLRSRLPTLMARIGRAGGAEAARATVAAGLTWQTCARLLHIPDPYAGTVAAVLIVETTVVATVSAATRYAAGCLLGVLLAVPGALYAEPGVVGLAVVVFASALLARHGFLGHQGLHVPTTALITFALVRGRHPDELAAHLGEIVLGLGFGLACGLLLFPAVRVRSAERALEELRLLVARNLDGLADAVVRHERPRAVLGPAWEDDLGTALTRARTAVGEAHESLRWNVRPTARRRRWHLDDRVLGKLTPLERFALGPTAYPAPFETPTQVTHHRVCSRGSIGVDHTQVGLGRRYYGKAATVFRTGDHLVVFIDNEMARELILDHSRIYQGRGR